MEIRIKNFVMRPDSTSTWSLSEMLTTKTGDNIGTTYEGNTTWPKDLKTCILRIREQLRREDPTICNSFNEGVARLEQLDQELKKYIDEAVTIK